MATNYASNYDQTIPFSDTCAQIALATGTARPYTVPGTERDKYSMLLSYISTSNVFVGWNVTAVTVGAGAMTTTQYIEFRPGADGTKRFVKGGDVISFITPDASAYVGLRLMQLPAQ